MKRVSFKRSDGTQVSFKAKKNPRTYEMAKKENIEELAKNGWKISDTSLKVPYATTPDGLLRLYFKPQAVYFSWIRNTRGYKHEFANARSIHFPMLAGDIRTITPKQFVKIIDEMNNSGRFHDEYTREYGHLNHNPKPRFKKNPIPPIDLATNLENFKSKTKIGKPYSLMTGRKFVPVTTVDGIFRTDVLVRGGKGEESISGDKIKERAFKQINLKSNPGNVEYLGHKIHVNNSVYTVLPYMKSFSGPTGFVQAKKWIEAHVKRESKR